MKKTIIALVITVVVIGAGAAVYFATRPESKQAPQVQQNLSTFTDQNGISFKYPSELEVLPISAKDKTDKIVFKAQKAGQQSLAVTVRYQDGIAKLSSLLKKSAPQLLIDEARKSYPGLYPGFKEVSSHSYTLNNKPAIDLVYTYNNQRSDVVKRRFLAVMKDSNTAYYVSGQALDQSYNSINEKYFEPIFSSIKFE